ncbi:sulfite reductase (NADPH) flavoprotein alpha-component [Sporothrix schenckii 1099-18]|uniref:assimilatory sulfite reductase (NADPH) n=1 Tax=Sporothrix schenckii 1099-18 TaxID=1397361 RepID=A0A0F2MB43_SPOSC|nr:sulfite reductase (NADPH) flavoprotein alpha-component [Sporothrix schenckii 1099-18]KJR86918.1 sulfite reductase (NADPH) flavoprotein alpha-component [Sporothrix schenckii 1099-18]
MQLKHEETTGSPGLPVDQPVDQPAAALKQLPATTAALASINGPTYATAQLLVQQVAYKLSDKIFAYSPETFDLDVAARHWESQQEKNVHGYPTTVVPLQTRAGAGAFALGYLFSEDFDKSKRTFPQTLVAPTASLRSLRAALDQLSLLYGVASPFVAHVAALDYAAQDGLVGDYSAALQTAEELGLGLVASTSAAEAQHMALFATLAARILPTLHVYDGLRTARETVRVTDALSEAHVAEAFARLSALHDERGALSKRLDHAGQLLELLQAFNSELGTSYQPFEYHGHDEAESVLVAFGSVEAQLAAHTVARLAVQGHKVGAVHVRVYRPFIEEAFLSVLPPTVRRMAVLGQVQNEAAVNEGSVQSALYADVLATVAFASSRWTETPAIVDVKYAAADAPTPAFISSVLQTLTGKPGVQASQYTVSLVPEHVQQYTFYDVDTSAALATPVSIARVVAEQPGAHVSTHNVHDNLVQGGVVRTDIRKADKAVSSAPFAVDAADVTVVGEEKLLKDIDILAGAKPTSALIVRLPNFKAEDAEKRLPANVRQALRLKQVRLYALDTAAVPAAEPHSKVLLEQAFLQVAHPELAADDLVRLAAAVNDAAAARACAEALSQALVAVEVPASWAEVPADYVAPSALVKTLRPSSFAVFDKTEAEPATAISDWQAAAKGLAFKEAYGTQTAVRPDLPVHTAVVTVAENRRLTPLEYERNIFHIEFDLGTSGLTYQIGEALGVHADNDTALVEEFIAFYGLDADALVQVPSREDAAAFETRTVYQALVQNVDILGKPPKRFYEALAAFATDDAERAKLTALGGKEGAEAFKQYSEVDTVTYVDVLQEFQSAHPAIEDLVRIVAPSKRREYSIASAQAVTPTTVALMIVVVDWVDSRGRKRYGNASRYLSLLRPGAQVTVSVKPSVMKLPALATTPLIMAGLGTGLAPFRAFVQYRAMQKARGEAIGSILLFMGSRHQREEYLYGEEWEAYVDAGVVTLLGAAFSRDQPEKIYIQDRMRQSMDDVIKAYIHEEGSFFLCGPTWPVPDLTDVLMESIAKEAKASGRKVDPHKEIDRLKENGRYVLEVY